MHAFSRLAILLILALGGAAAAQDLTTLSLEDLMNVTVTSVSKKEQFLSRSPAAAFVLTSEDIRRSGMTNVPDLLRLVPGVNVARIASNGWAISIRGFNDRHASKVLVMVDGRSIYSAEFSGVFWDQWSVPLEDIDRIEVVRGPGGTMWGANAMNGVINIITKPAAKTQGGLVAAGVGSADTSQNYVRYGGTIGGRGTYRVYGRYFTAGESEYRDRTAAADGWIGRQAGFRTDWTLSPGSLLMVEGDMTDTDAGQQVSVVTSSGGWRERTFDEIVGARTRNILVRWNHAFRNGSEARIQLFHSQADRHERGNRYNHTADGEAQYRFGLGERHDVVAGIGFRHTGVTLEPEDNFVYDQRTLAVSLASAFMQDEIALSKSWTVTLGSKFERNSFTGFEVEPSGQILWSPNDRQAAWLSVSRAIRQPSLFENHSTVDIAVAPMPNGLVGVSHFSGNPEVKVEQSLSYEAGYRTAIGPRFTLDASVFRSNYRDLLTAEIGTPYLVPRPRPYILIPGTFGNRAGARTYGGEILAVLQATDAWRLTAGYSYLQMKAWPYAGSTDISVARQPGNSPKHQWQVRSAYQLGRTMDWDVNAFYVHSLRTQIRNIPDSIPSYLRLDARFAWRPFESTELSVVGQNLLSPRRPEFPSPHLITATQVQRAVFGKLAWTF